MSELDEVMLRQEQYESDNVGEHSRLWEAIDNANNMRSAGDEASRNETNIVDSRVTVHGKTISTEVTERKAGELRLLQYMQSVGFDLDDLSVEVRQKLVDILLKHEQDYSILAGEVSNALTLVQSFQRYVDTRVESERLVREKEASKFDARVAKYESMLMDITIDSDQITMDNGELRWGAWTILSQAREWDLEILSMVKTMKIGIQTDINQSKEDLLELIPGDDHILEKAIEAITTSPVIQAIDKAIQDNIKNINSTQESLLNRANELLTQINNVSAANADALIQEAANRAHELASESQARLDALAREAKIRAAQMQQIAADQEELLNERIAEIEVSLDTDLSSVNTRIEEVNKKADSIQQSTDQKVLEIHQQADELIAENERLATTIIQETLNRNNAIIAEVTARNEAINLESTARINAIAAEAKNRSDALNAEALARNTAITEEALARSNAIAAEAQARTSQIIAAINQEKTDRNAAIAIESQKRIDDIATEAAARANAIGKETLDRKAAITQEVTDRNLAITTKANEINADVAAKVKTLNDGITQEIVNRQQGDTTIAGELNAYKTSNDKSVAAVLVKAESAISGNASTATQLDALNTSFQNMTIGGENLWAFINTGSNDYGTATREVLATDNSHQKLTITGTKSGTFSNLWQQLRITGVEFALDKTFSASFEIKPSVAKIRVFLYVWGITNPFANRLVEVIPNQWNTIKFEGMACRDFADNKSPTYGGLLGIRYLASDVGITEEALIGQTLEIRNLSIQEGNKATGYTRPIRLVQSELNTSINNVIKAYSDADKALGTRIDTTNTTVKNNDTAVRGLVQTVSQSVTTLESSTNTRFTTVEANLQKTDTKAGTGITNAAKAQETADAAVTAANSNASRLVTLDASFTAYKADTDASISQTNAKIDNVERATASADSALATRIDTVEAKAATDTSESQALITAESTARTQADSALASQIESLGASTTTEFANTNAAILTEQTARTSADSALAERIDVLTATTSTDVADLNAGIVSERTARTNADDALGQRIDSVTATAQTDKTDLTAKITQEVTARTTADSALSLRVDNLTTVVSDNNRVVTGSIADVAKNLTTLEGATNTRLSSLETRLVNTDKEIGIVKTAAAAAQSTADTAVANDKATSNRLDMLNASFRAISTAGQNLLKASNIPSIRKPGYYQIGTYEIGQMAEVGKVYTLVTCVTIERAATDNVCYLVGYEGAGSPIRFTEEVAGSSNKTQQVLKATFTWRQVSDLNRVRINFYWVPYGPAGTSGPGNDSKVTIHWACLYEGETLPVSGWQQSPFDVDAKFIETNASISSLSQTVATADTALSSRIDLLAASTTTEIGKTNSAVTSEQKARSDADTALGQRIDSVVATATTDKGNLTSLINTEATARVREDEALASRINLLSASTAIDIANSNAAIKTEETARTNADSALSERINVLSANTQTELGKTNVAITTEQTARTTADDALGKRIDAIVSSTATDTSNLQAAITAEQLARTTQDSALASRIDSLTATVSDNDTAVKGQIQNVAKTVTTLEGNVTTQFNSLQSKLDATNTEVGVAKSAAAAAQTTANTAVSDARAVAGRTTTLESKMSTVESEVAKKLNASIINNYYTKTQAEGKALEIAAGEVNKYDVSLQIGGVNLIRSEPDIRLVSNNSSTYPVLNTVVDGIRYVERIAPFTSSELSTYVNSNLVNVEAGKTYTFSMEVKPVKGTLRLRARTSSIADNGVTPFASTFGEYKDCPKDVWTKLTVTVKAVNSGAARPPSLYGSEFTAETGAIAYRNFQIEEGTKATSFIESPLDTQSKLNANATAISNTNTEVTRVDGIVKAQGTSINQLQSNLSALDTKANTINQAAALAQQTADTAVTNDAATASTLSQLKSTYEAKVADIDANIANTASKASADLSSAQTTLTNADTALGARIDTIAAGLTTTNGTLATKADSTALTATNAEVSRINGAVISQGQSITNLQSSITSINGTLATKANTSTVDALTTRVTQTENTLVTESGKITQLQNSLTTVKTTADAALPRITGTTYKSFKNVLNAYLSNASYAGNIVIDTPITFSNKMFRISGKGYNYTSTRSVIDFAVTGYVFSNGTILQHGSSNTGTLPLRIRLGVKEGKIVVILNCTTGNWAYPQFTVDAEIGYTTAPDSWKDGWVLRSVLEADLVNDGITSIMEPSIYDPKTEITANATATSNLRTDLTKVDGTVKTQSTQITNLQNSITAINGTLTNKADSSAVSSLNSKVNTIEGTVTSQGIDLTQIKNSIEQVNGVLSTKADSSSLATLTNTVNQHDDAINAHSSDIVSLTNSLANTDYVVSTKADSAALETLTSMVIEEADKLSSESNKVTQLENNLSTTNSNLADVLGVANQAIDIANTKADAGALQALESKVTNEADKTISNSSDITRLTGRMDIAERDINLKADASALDAVTTTVTQHGDSLASQGNAITSLTATQNSLIEDISLKADASTVSDLLATVFQQGKDITSNSNSITSLGNRLTTAESNISKKADASAVQTLTNSVSTIDGKVTSQGNAITSLQGSVNTISTELAKKVNASVLANYYQKTEADTAIAGQISSYDASLVIGGTNLLSESNKFLVGGGGSGITKEVLPDGSLKLTGMGTTYYTFTPAKTQNSDMSMLKVGDKFTVTLWIKAVDVANLPTKMPHLYLEIDKVYRNNFNVLGDLAKGGLVRYVQTRTCTSASSKLGNSHMHWYDGALGGGLIIQKWQIEVGTKSSDWSPGISDTQDQLNANATAISTTNTEVSRINGLVISQGQSITSLQNSLSTLTTTVSNKADASALTSLDNKVTVLDGTVKTQGTSITTLTNNLNTTTTNANAALAAVQVKDTRDTNELPNWYWTNHSRRIVNEFKRASAIGVSGLGSYVNLETRVYYSDSSGGPIIQIAYAATDPLLQMVRYSSGINANAVWGEWRQPLKGLNDAINTKASTTALSTLDTKVINVDGRVTANANKLDLLEASLQQTNELLGTVNTATAAAQSTANAAVTANEATATSLSILQSAFDTKVGLIDSDIASNAIKAASDLSEARTTLTNADNALSDRINTLNTTMISDKNAINGRIDDVATSVTTLTSNTNTRITDLQSSLATTNTNVNKKADASALTTTNTKVTEIDGAVKTQATSINNLTSRTTATENVANNAELLARVFNSGKLLFSDPTFKQGLNSVKIYRTSTTEHTLSYIPRNSDNPTTSTNEVEISVTSEGARVGGFYQTIYSRANAVFLIKYIMKLPVGLSVETVSNALGTGGTKSIIGNKEGTGKYETYYCLVRCGYEGTFSTAGYIRALRSTGSTLPAASIEAPIKWYLASIEAYDVTDFEDAIPSIKETLATYGTAIQTLTAEDSALSQRIETLKTSVAGKADNTAFSTLQSQVTTNKNDIATHTTSITGLQTSLNNLTGTVGTKADASSLATLDSRVSTIDGTVTTNSSDITSLKNSLTTVNGALETKATIEALNSTITEVSRINNAVVSQGTQLTQLSTSLTEGLNTKANADAFNALNIKVTNIDGRVTSTAETLSNLTSTVGDHTTTLGIHGKVINGMEGSYAVSLDTNGVLAGFALVSKTDTNGKVTTAFGVNAQNFYIGAPTNNKKPFIVTTIPQTINGVTYPAGTWIDVAFIATATIGTAHIADLAVTRAKIANLAVGTAQIDDLAVNSAKIAYLAVKEAHIQDLSVTNMKIADLAVDNAKIKDLSVSTVKIQNEAVTVPVGARYNRLSITTDSINAAMKTYAQQQGWVRPDGGWDYPTTLNETMLLWEAATPTLFSITIPRAGGKCRVDLSINASHTVTTFIAVTPGNQPEAVLRDTRLFISLYRDGAFIGRTSIAPTALVGTTVGFTGNIALMALDDSNIVGNVTYTAKLGFGYVGVNTGIKVSPYMGIINLDQMTVSALELKK